MKLPHPAPSSKPESEPTPAVQYDHEGRPIPTNLREHLTIADLPDAEYRAALSAWRRERRTRRHNGEQTSAY